MFTVQKGRVLVLSKGLDDDGGGRVSKTGLDNNRWPFGELKQISTQVNFTNRQGGGDWQSQMTETRHAMTQVWIDTQKAGALAQEYLRQFGRIGI